MDGYDAIPYESTPFHETHPGFLAPLARLFGLEAPHPARARVLELGCASGSNLIPMAWHLPASRFVGIELSATQAADGVELVTRLGLKNVEIRQGDILAFNRSEGEFDYIIAHGVYSWVPAPVRERILGLCRDHLSPQGVAYISYNVLPGWRMRGALRDMLLYHTRGLATPAQRLKAAQEFLAGLLAGTRGLDAYSSRFLREEIQRIQSRHPSYLYHEYLEETNQPFLFSDFVADAARHGLRYVCDTELHSLFPATLGDEAAAMLEGIDDDIALWQYMDFLASRNFRQSLLCREENVLQADPDLDRFTGYSFYADLRPPKKLDLRRSKPAPFTAPDGAAHEVFHPLTKAALAYLGAHYPAAVGFDELLAQAQQAVGAAGAAATAGETDHLASELFGLFAHQLVGATLEAEPRVGSTAERPRASALARAQAATGDDHLTTSRHLSLGLDPFARAVVGHLDGTRTREELQSQLAAEVLASPELIPNGSALVNNPQRLHQTIGQNLERLLALFTRYGVLD